MEDKKQNHEKGQRYESLSADYLRSQGFLILSKNYRFHRNEIDLIAKEGDCLVFIEVKARSRSEKGYGFQAVDRRKQERIRRVAEHYHLIL